MFSPYMLSSMLWTPYRLLWVNNSTSQSNGNEQAGSGLHEALTNLHQDSSSLLYHTQHNDVEPNFIMKMQQQTILSIVTSIEWDQNIAWWEHDFNIIQKRVLGEAEATSILICMTITYDMTKGGVKERSEKVLWCNQISILYSHFLRQ